MAGEYTPNNAQQTIETLDQFADDDNKKAGAYDRWDTEIAAARSANRKWVKQGNHTVAKYSNDRSVSEGKHFRLNLFHSNIQTLMALMFGKLPEIKFSRQNIDYNDDIARVAGMMLERMLNADIGTPNDQYSQSLRMNLEDRMLPGLGVSRVRYDFDEEERTVAAVIDQQTGAVIQPERTESVIIDERAPLDYVHWRDFLWGPARIWAEVPWVAFRTLMKRQELIERFGEEVGKLIPLLASVYTREEQTFTEREDPKQDAWKRAEIWEIWSKTDKKVYWWCKDHNDILDVKDDPLQLTGFFPNPEPLASNVTTTAYMPIPDFVMAQDLYNEIDRLETRIILITEAIKVVGVYDMAAEGVKRMLTEGVENDLIPVDNWAMFAEKGGIQGSVDWLPVAEIAQTMMVLVDRRNDAKQLLYEVNGISDIMRGAHAAGGAVSATERALEARFASVRVQALQDEFAKYATDLIRLRAEVISRHFQPETIVKQSNIQLTADAQLAPQAAQLIKDTTEIIWRVEVKPESVSMVDYAQLKEERTAYITALATYMQSAAPLVQQSPESAPILLEMLKWGLAGFKGSNEVEGIIDQVINQMQQAKPEEENKQPSPEEIKAKMETQRQQFEQQKAQSLQAFEREKWVADQAQEERLAKFRQIEITMEGQARIDQEKAQASLNMQEEEHETMEYIKRKQADARYTPAPAAAPAKKDD